MTGLISTSIVSFMPRIARTVIPEYPHHIIQRGNNKQTIFFDNQDKKVYLDLLKKYSQECGCKIGAYCLMCNHVHILAVPCHKDSLAKCMQKISLRFTQYINKKYKRTGRLWECRFHSGLVDKDEYLWAVTRYIERNPVRAKIVTDPCQYEWSSARINMNDRKDDFVKVIWQSHEEREEYINYLKHQEDIAEIKKIKEHTYKGKPIGTEKFVKFVAELLGINLIARPRGRPVKIKDENIKK